MSELHVLVTEITVSLLPADNINRDPWCVKVVWRGGDKYAVKFLSKVFNSDGEWEYEPIPSSREDDFIERTRFDYLTAYATACHHAPLIRINGMTAADVLAKAGDDDA